MADGDKTPEPDEYKAALSRYRDTAKWALTGLGAAAIAAIAGFGLADTGKLSLTQSPLRFIVAAVGVIAAVAGFLGAILQALRLASESWTNPPDLVTRPCESPTAVQQLVNNPANGLLAGYDSFEQLSQAHVQALARWKTESERATRVADDSSLQLQARWQDRALFLATAVHQATLVASTARLRAKFKTSSKSLMVFGGVAAVGIIIFAWAVTAPKPDTKLVVLGPVPKRGTLAISDAASDGLRAVLGPTCDLKAIDVLVTGAETDGTPTVVVDDPDCSSVTLPIPTSTGTITAR